MRAAMRRRAGLLTALAICLASIAPIASAQPEDDADASATAAVETEATRKARGLASILLSRRALSEELAELQAELETDAALGREQAILDDIQEISLKLADLEVSFSELAAEIDPGEFADGDGDATIDLGGEVRELLSPLVSELKRATSRPREMERLRTVIGQTGDRIERIQQGLGNLAVLTANVSDPALLEALQRERSEWLSLHLELATRYEIDRQKLEQMLSEQPSFGEVMESVFELFFKSRGRNLILALTATILFMLLLRRLHARALESTALRSRGDALLPRLLNLLFVLFMGIGGVLVFLLVLYLFGDWVLLILMLLVVFGALWASKQAIPHFWNQGTLLLNLGPVREGERLSLGGIPWRIEKLNFYTELVNERLVGGTLRLPISDLTDLRSRSFDETEPWFPTETGDWVVLSDDTFGMIEVQTPEQVVLRLMGGVVKTVPTADFLALKPTNVSGGFTSNLIFGLDYAHLPAITTTIPLAMQDFLRDGLRGSPVAEWIENVEVFFNEAAASSLDLRIVVTLSGGAAPFYKVVPRLASRVCVDACNAHGWQIPFPQLTVHRGGATLDDAAH